MKWISIKKEGLPNKNMIGENVLCWLKNGKKPICTIYHDHGVFIETRQSDIHDDNEDIVTHWCKIIKPKI